MAGYNMFKVGILFSVVLVCQAFPDMEDYLKIDAIDVNSDEFGQVMGKTSTNCSCGWTNKARIVGGKETLANEYPLIAGIRETADENIFCGGTIITNYHVLTAAHCTFPFRNSGVQLVVVLGEHDQSKVDKGTVIIEVERAIEHENYDPSKYFNDISLLVLREKINYNQIIGPACLPSAKTNLVNEQVKVIGWGTLGYRKDLSKVLMKVNLRVIPLTVCKQNFRREIHADIPSQICTKAQNKDSCGGDSGGPVIWLDPETNRYTLVALVSYGKTKCGGKEPAVNTDVSYHLDWLQKKIADTKPGMHTCSKV
uniref:Venom S1 protease 1 n=1 Tax=Lethocerus distinctifemur TaxID=280095 RepID=A0A2K8JLC4_9HEMI|nr:venom S1 protease 1 [Lethocerus distinctifemur]